MIKNIPISFIKLAMQTLGLSSLNDRGVQRLSTCYKCNGGEATCPMCGCFVKAKVQEKDENCPKGLWK